MALEPCKVCGTLNSSESEICLSCGYPTSGRKRPKIFQLAAVALITVFILPLLLSVINWFKFNLNPQDESPQQSEISFFQYELDKNPKS